MGETGTLIKEIELDGERLKYQRLANGNGPNIGWVSIKLKEKVLVQREDAPPTPEVEPAPQVQGESVTDRKLRILALPGSGANSNILQFSLMPLMKFLGSEVEWLWLEPPLQWQSMGAEGPEPFRERSELEVRLSKGLPFT